MSKPSFQFQKVDPSILEHAHEKRGFVNVPLDYAHPEGEKLQLFYRFLPRYNRPLEGDDAPLIVVINGGPGLAANLYRPLDFDYEKNEMPGGAFDRFHYILNDFRVLLVDQRGTKGGSAPLDMEDEDLDYEAVAKYFSSDAHARDTASVISALTSKDEDFLIIAQSYGGIPGMQYLALLREGVRRPKGIIFSSSAFPFGNPEKASRERREEQYQLNLALKEAIPDFPALAEKLRAHLRSLALPEAHFHEYWSYLGHGMDEQWPKDLEAAFYRVLSLGKEALLNELETQVQMPLLLNYILSSANFTPGFTDRTLSQKSADALPFEDWMIDENVVTQEIGQVGKNLPAWVSKMDASPPKPTPMPPLEVLRAALRNMPALFTAANNDAMVPRATYEKASQMFMNGPQNELHFLEGGHNAIFDKEGHALLLDWAKRLGLIGKD